MWHASLIHSNCPTTSSCETGPWLTTFWGHCLYVFFFFVISDVCISFTAMSTYNECMTSSMSQLLAAIMHFIAALFILHLHCIYMKFVANKMWWFCTIYTGMHCDRWYCHEIKSQLVFVGHVVSPLAWSPWHCLCPVPLGLVPMALPVSPCKFTQCTPVPIWNMTSAWNKS